MASRGLNVSYLLTSCDISGVIAQEVQELLPSAVMDVGDVVCSDGEVIQNFLMVDKVSLHLSSVFKCPIIKGDLLCKIQFLPIFTLPFGSPRTVQPFFFLQCVFDFWCLKISRSKAS